MRTSSPTPVSPARTRPALLPVSDALLVARIATFVVALPVICRLRLARLDRLLRPGGSEPSIGAEREEAVRRYVEGTLSRLRLNRPPSCLERGVTLCYFLRRANLDVRLAFGVGPDGEEYAGHCWLVRDGAPFLEHTDPRPRFAEVVTLPQVPEHA